MSPDGRLGTEADLRRYEALLQMADLVVRHHSLEELFSNLAQRLHTVIQFEVAGFCLHDPARNVLQLRVWEGGELVHAPAELPMEDTTAGWVWLNQQPLAFADVQPETRFLTCLNIVKEKGIRGFCELPLTTPRKRLGALSLGSFQPGVYGETDLRLLLRVAQLVAVAVENAITSEALDREKERLQMLLEVNSALVSNLNLQELFPAISGYIRQVVRHDFASISLYDPSAQMLRRYALDFPSAPDLFTVGQTFSVKNTSAGQTFLERQAKIYGREQLAAFNSDFTQKLLQHGIQTVCCVPLTTRNGTAGTLNLASKAENAFGEQNVNLLKQIASQIGIALENDRAYRELAQFKDRLAEEKNYLQGEIRSELKFEEIVGESPALRRVLEQTKTVASSDATVLVLGETGTGKELIARAIHRMSARKDASFIKMNCAAIPTGLLESELFGHEKGAFTGAISQKIGRLEVADRGTLFLDEVGDIPMELQPKLLRVLQDQEFERLGGTRTIKVNVRLIAATNLDLEKSVVHKEFRSDLYYRLNVFPIRMPPLRERIRDIPLLVRYFVHKSCQRLNKHIESIPMETMRALEQWSWPGNVRELENIIERSVILSSGPTLSVPLTELRALEAPAEGRDRLESLEREHIVRMLRETGGVVAGVRGAAARLGLKRSTLQSRIQRLGISRQEYEN